MNTNSSNDFEEVESASNFLRAHDFTAKPIFKGFYVETFTEHVASVDKDITNHVFRDLNGKKCHLANFSGVNRGINFVKEKVTNVEIHEVLFTFEYTGTTLYKGKNIKQFDVTFQRSKQKKQVDEQPF